MAAKADWRKGNLWYWNKQLLQYFFESRQPDDVPVTCLVVTAEELARATGDDSAVPSEVLHAFTDALRHELGRGKRSLCADALDTDWRPTLYYDIPPFVSHLIATCVARVWRITDFPRISNSPHTGSDVAQIRRGEIAAKRRLRTCPC